jgi:hypothetical protein
VPLSARNIVVPYRNKPPEVKMGRTATGHTWTECLVPRDLTCLTIAKLHFEYKVFPSQRQHPHLSRQQAPSELP